MRAWGCALPSDDDLAALSALMGDQQMLAWASAVLVPHIRRLCELRAAKAVSDATAPLHVRIRSLEAELARVRASVRALGEVA
jgi:hypothetical protein